MAYNQEAQIAKQKLEEAGIFLDNEEWRLSNLYHIINEDGKKVLFKLRKVQKTLYENMHNRNVIPKARQLGFSTFIGILALDRALWNNNYSVGIVADKEENAKALGEKIAFAYDNLPDYIKKMTPTITNNVQTMKLSNGSLIKTGVSLHSGTYQFLHISELGVLDRRSPHNATMLMKSALNTVSKDGLIFIESTADGGSQGEFYNRCITAQQCTHLTTMDFKLHFFPWFQNDKYASDEYKNIPDYEIDMDSQQYFTKLAIEHNIRLTMEQKFWYVKKEKETPAMKEQFPSYLEECFEATDRDKVYYKEMLEVRKDGRILEFPVEKGVPVHTAWDLGRSDYTCVLFFQMIQKEIRQVDCIQVNGEYIGQILDTVLKKGYTLGTCHLPHDCKANLLSAEKSIWQMFRDAGLKVNYVSQTRSVELDLHQVKKFFERFWFKESTTQIAIKMLDGYRRKWSEGLGAYTGFIKEESHMADALRTLVMGLQEESKPDKPKKRQVRNPITGQLTWEMR